MEFPHLPDTEFPNFGNVDPYEYQNKFDYTRWGEKAKIKLCTVPWVSDGSHVVKFDTNAARDVYLDALTGCQHTLESAQRILPTGEVRLPIPANAATEYNYLVVDTPTMPTAGQPLDFAIPNVSRFCYFVETIEYASPSTTRFILTLDVWTTFINDVTISQIWLERGHLPAASITPEQYLTDPLNNSSMLLTQDFNAGELQRVKSQNNLVFNDSVYACFATNANPTGTWGSEDTMATPGFRRNVTDGVPAPYLFAMETSSLRTFLYEIDEDIPQFKSTVLGVFFIPKKLVSVGEKFTFGSVECFPLTPLHNVNLNIATLTPSLFGYPEQARPFAKLYTWPYAALEIVDDQGVSTVLKIEDTDGKISFTANVNLVFPYIQISGSLLGIGGSTPNTISFQNITTQSFRTSGRWYETLRTWDVPVYQVVQTAPRHTAYSGYYDREQQKKARDNSYASAKASNATAKDNADNSAATSRSNNLTSVTANDSIITNTKNSNLQGLEYSNNKIKADTTEDLNMAIAGYNAKSEGYAMNATMNNASAISSAVGTIEAAAMGGAIGGPAGAVGGALASLASTGANWVAGQVSNSVAMFQNDVIYDQQVTSMNAKTKNAVDFANLSTKLNNTQLTENNTVSNNAATTITNHNATLTETNASNTKTTADANADRSKDTATSAITNAINQANLSAPYTFGSLNNASSGTVRPMMLSANVLTQSDNAILQAASQFARYGYTLDQMVTFTTFNVAKFFAYWKCSDVWFDGSQCVNESITAGIIELLENGVTVWRDPNKIGKVNIYDNI